jgi:hypothetical protein
MSEERPDWGQVMQTARDDQERAREVKEGAQEYEGLSMDALLGLLEEELQKPGAFADAREVADFGDDLESLLGEMIDNRRGAADDPGLPADVREKCRRAAGELDAALAKFQAERPAADDDDQE